MGFALPDGMFGSYLYAGAAPDLMGEKHSFQLFADYFQFYLLDEAAVADLSEAWTPEASIECSRSRPESSALALRGISNPGAP